jgi:hypothetical protein
MLPPNIPSRREMLARSGLGLGTLALAPLLGHAATTTATPRPGEVGINPLAPRPPQFPVKAKHVIHIFANGGPSHVDTFDPKPMLTKFHGKPLPTPNLRTERKTGAAFGSPFKFSRYGKSGIEVSELFASTARHVDDMAIIRSMHANVPNHEPSLLLMNCGEARQVRPSLGSWLCYGLGTENQNLPGFVAMCPNGFPIQESQNWQAGFLPGVYQGTYINSAHTSVDKLIEHVTPHAAPAEQRRQLDLLQRLNRRHQQARPGDPQLEARLQSFELAYRMQTEASDAFDVSREPRKVLEAYSPDGKGNLPPQARQLLIARRLIERGVRFVQLWHGAGQPWDNHDDLEVNHRKLAKQCDRAIAALMDDLKRLGLFDETLIIWGGEFGRTPVVELPTSGANAGKINGRDHNHHGFSMWLAGGGVKGGQVYGATDEFGFAAAENKVHVHDLHATILRLMGFDHETFTFRYAGRDFRLTDVHGRVVRELIA